MKISGEMHYLWCAVDHEGDVLERFVTRRRDGKAVLKFITLQSSVHNHFNQERHFYSRANLRLKRTAALGQWRQLCSA